MKNETVEWQGAKAKIIRRSPRTGDYVIELLEDKPPYRKGNQVSVHPYEVKKV